MTNILNQMEVLHTPNGHALKKGMGFGVCTRHNPRKIIHIHFAASRQIDVSAALFAPYTAMGVWSFELETPSHWQTSRKGGASQYERTKLRFPPKGHGWVFYNICFAGGHFLAGTPTIWGVHILRQPHLL